MSVTWTSFTVAIHKIETQIIFQQDWPFMLQEGSLYYSENHVKQKHVVYQGLALKLHFVHKYKFGKNFFPLTLGSEISF
jgi:hypothetical protein